MLNKKLSLMLMLLMILIFFAMIMAYLAFSNGGDQKKIQELESNDKILNEKIEEIKIRTDEWDRIINGTTEVEMETGTPPATVGTPAETPPAAEAPKEEAAAEAQPEPKQPMAVKATNLNLRSKPSGTGAVVRKLPNGEKVTPTGNEQQAEGYLWLEITDAAGNKGWVAKDFLQ